MKKSLCILTAVICLSGCQTLSEQDPAAYQKSLTEAQKIIKGKVAFDRYKVYYDDKNHKAFAQSVVNTTSGYSSYESSVEKAKQVALEQCQLRLLKKFEKIDDKVKCKIINVDNQWVNQ